MKHNIFLITGIGLLLLIWGCKNDIAEIADITNISATTLYEELISQPISRDGELISIIYKDDLVQLCSYKVNDKASDYNWIFDISKYGFGGGSPLYANVLELAQNVSNDLFLKMFQPSGNGGYVKFVKFNNAGSFQWQTGDSIHQPDNIVIDDQNINLTTKKFRYGGMVFPSNGGVSVISAVDSVNIDSTFLQITNYGSDGRFSHNTYLKFPGSWELTDVYNTSDNKLLLVTNERRLNLSHFRLIDTTGFVYFDQEPDLLILKTHFFFENSQGQYMVSCSYLENSNLAHGVVFCVDELGVLLWPPIVSDIGSSGSLLLGVNELDDGYLFSGVKTGSAFFEWRDDFDAYDYQAVLMKTDLTGNILWQNNELFNNSYFKSAAAGVIFEKNINMFISRDDGPAKNVSILKLDNEGNIKN